MRSDRTVSPIDSFLKHCANCMNCVYTISSWPSHGSYRGSNPLGSAKLFKALASPPFQAANATQTFATELHDDIVYTQFIQFAQSAKRSNCKPNRFVSETLRKLYELRVHDIVVALSRQLQGFESSRECQIIQSVSFAAVPGGERYANFRDGAP